MGIISQEKKDMSCLDMTCLGGMKLGLALSGGGALGAYQVGALQAIQQLGLYNHIHAVAGTSIGSLNGALFCSQQLEQLQQLWVSAELGQVFARLKEHPNQNELDKKAYLKLVKEFATTLRLDVEPLKNLIRQTVSEEKMRASRIDFSLNIWNVFKFRGESYQLNQIPQGQLAEYLIASSSFPLFLPHKIDNQYYLDGGIDINLPLNLPMQNQSIDHVIAIDVATFMKYRPKQIWLTYKNKDKLTIIRPSKHIGSPAYFSRENIKQQIKTGYEDTLKQLSQEWINKIAG